MITIITNKSLNASIVAGSKMSKTLELFEKHSTDDPRPSGGSQAQDHGIIGISGKVQFTLQNVASFN